MSDVVGEQIVFAYFTIGNMIVLYVVAIVSLALPKWDDVSDLSIFIVCLDLMSLFCMWLE